MLALQSPQGVNPSSPKTEPDSSSSTCRCTPNILPCRIHHDGPLDSTLGRYWNPTTDKNGDDASAANTNNTQTAYFRGRKLKGHRVPIPSGYQGIIATQTDRTLPSQQPPNSNPNPQEEEDEDEDEEDEEEPVKILEKTSTFDEFTVWSHERVPVASEDPFIRGVEEWMRFAEVIHSNPEESDTAATATLTSRSKISDGESNSK